MTQKDSGLVKELDCMENPVLIRSGRQGNFSKNWNLAPVQDPGVHRDLMHTLLGQQRGSSVGAVCSHSVHLTG